MADIDSITNYTKTQRILLLIDLTPFLHFPHHHPNPYLTTLLSAAKTLLSFAPLSSSLFSFKLFFSSLCPLLSASKLPPLSSLSFDLPDSTFLSLSRTLTSLLPSPITSPPSPNASHLAASLRQLLHEYAWEWNSVAADTSAGMLPPPNSYSHSHPFLVKSNLVVLFSPILSSCTSTSEFLNVELGDECLRNVNAFNHNFRGFFKNVNEAFADRDILFSWVDVNCEMGCFSERSELLFGFFKSAIRGLGWGFSSSDAIVLGSALFPFGLIYPCIGTTLNIADINDCGETIRVQLSLEILDVSGKPLECKCSDLELIKLNMFLMDLQPASCERRKTGWEDFSDGITKLHIKAVQMYDKCAKFETSLSDPILVRAFLGYSDKNEEESCCEVFEYKVLETLGVMMDDSVPRKFIPVWQILLSFLYREGYCASVSLINGDGNSFAGILKPFTVSSALLSIVGNEFQPHNLIGESSLGQMVKMTEKNVIKPKIDLNHSHELMGFHSGPSSLDLCAELEAGRRKKNKKNLNMLQELTWTAFCKLALEQFHIDLEEVYFSRGCKSKKLKFLKCWMKQIKKCSYNSLNLVDRSKPHKDVAEDLDSKLTKLSQESQQPITSCASAGEHPLKVASRAQDEAAFDFCFETLDSFFADLPHKIQQGLNSEDIDLGCLAERLVHSTIHCLYKKHEKEVTSESQNPTVNLDGASASVFAVELTNLLLREPKDLAATHRDSDLSFLASSPCSTEVASENIVRAYELQILFRMEILKSDVGARIGESMKQKFVKHICLLLERIQCHLKGDFFGDWSLDKYVGNVIQRRYCHTLGDVVRRIYGKLDLSLFSEEDESPNPILNSADSTKSHTGEMERDNRDNSYSSINETNSAEYEPLQLVENGSQSPSDMKQEEHAHKLIEARERRQRARRFASFSSWVPDLQKVWAPKQPKAMKSKSDPLRRLFKRKGQRTSYDFVCNTPMTESKRSCKGGDINDETFHQDCRTSLSGSVSKALFQDD